MKHVYLFLKGMMAALLLLCVPSVSQAQVTCDDLNGTWNFKAGSVTFGDGETDGLPSDSYTVQMTGDAYTLRVTMTGLIGDVITSSGDVSSLMGTFSGTNPFFQFAYLSMAPGSYITADGATYTLSQQFTLTCKKLSDGTVTMETPSGEPIEFNYVKGDRSTTCSFDEVTLTRAEDPTPEPQPVNVTVTPAPGHYESMPASFTVTTDGADIAEATVSYRSSNTSLRGEDLDNESITLSGSSISFTLPEAAVYNAADLTLTITMQDVDGNFVTYGDVEDMVIAQYTADTRHDVFNVLSVSPDPAAGAVSSLQAFTLTMNGDATNDFIGGFDTSKQIELRDADGQAVATGTIDYADPDAYITNDALITLDHEVTEPGTYTLYVPEATVYNSLFDGNEDDLGLSWGATYNPEFTATYTVEVPTEPLGEGVTELSDLSNAKAYVLHNPAMRAYAVATAAAGNKVWVANETSGSKFSASVNDLDVTSANDSWMAIQKDGYFYLYNLGVKMYLTTPGWYANNQVCYACEFSAEPTPLTVVKRSDNYLALSSSANDDHDFLCLNASFVSENRPATNWTSDDSGSGWELQENPNVEIDPDVVNGIVTAINTATADRAAAKGIYTLSGVKLNAKDASQLEKGVYIIDGRKVVVK